MLPWSAENCPAKADACIGPKSAQGYPPTSKHRQRGDPVPGAGAPKIIRGSSFNPGFSVVTDVNAFDQEENILGDIGGMVGKPFQVARHKHEVDSLTDRLGVAFHVTDQLLVNRAAQLVDGVVRNQHGAGKLRVAFHKSIQAFANHCLHAAGHGRNINEGLDQGLVHQGKCTLDDVDRQISHPLEVVVDLNGGGEKAQVGGHGLLESQQLGSEIVDLDLHAIDL